MIIFTYLALGDSYTIGEQVRLTESFPYQTIQLLRKSKSFRDKNLLFAAPEIIAKTGWTTDELSAAMDTYNTLEKYDFVSLLIGVNNQYRGKIAAEFEIEFEHLLKRAIVFGIHAAASVFVLSIPDWGVTPFALNRDQEKIAMDIDDYNDACERVSRKYRVNYIDITPAQREDGSLDDFLAADGLHPSAKEYYKWAVQLSEGIGRIVEAHSQPFSQG